MRSRLSSGSGEYELFIYKHSVDLTQRQRGSGDTLIGSDGAAVLIGSAGDDRYIGDLLEDQFLGFSAYDFFGPANTAPVAVDDVLLTGENKAAAIRAAISMNWAMPTRPP